MEKEKIAAITLAAINLVFGIVFCALISWVISKMPDMVPVNFNAVNGAVEVLSRASKIAVFLPVVFYFR